MDRTHLSRKAKHNQIVYTETDYISDAEVFDNILDNLEIFNELSLGTGVRAKVKIKARVFLGEYTGLKISRNKAISRMNGNSCHYVVATSYPNRFIDGEGILGNILKYVNHKCKHPNCKLVKLTQGRVGLQTVREILPWESLNYNYRHQYFEGHLIKLTKCLCCFDCPVFF